MARPAPIDIDEETIPVPGSVRFPVELTPPDGFDPARLETWLRVEGRLGLVGGRLLYMPPCGDRQQDTVADVVVTLGNWVRAHREFVVGTNEAGMRLGEDSRGADAAVFRRADVGAYEGGFRCVPPVLAVEVAGRYGGGPELREEGGWCRAAGGGVVGSVVRRVRGVS